MSDAIVLDHFFVPGNAEYGWENQCSVKVPVIEAELQVGACCGYPHEAHPVEGEERDLTDRETLVQMLLKVYRETPECSDPHLLTAKVIVALGGEGELMEFDRDQRKALEAVGRISGAAQCPSSIEVTVMGVRRCILYAGHEGNHGDGKFEWASR